MRQRVATGQMGCLHEGDPARLQYARRRGEIASGDEHRVAALA
jgi:hypothetical protein